MLQRFDRSGRIERGWRPHVRLKRRDGAMYRAYYSHGVVSKVLSLTLLGVAILFVGPVILTVVVTVVGLILPFAVVGAIAYGPYLLVRRALGYRRPVNLEVRRVLPSRPNVAVNHPPLAARVIDRPVARRHGII